MGLTRGPCVARRLVRLPRFVRFGAKSGGRDYGRVRVLSPTAEFQRANIVVREPHRAGDLHLKMMQVGSFVPDA